MIFTYLKSDAAHKYLKNRREYSIMEVSRIFFILILILLSGTGAYALDSKIPKEGTVFVGENDLDISDCNVRTGDEIAFWSSGSPEGTPDSRAKVMDARHFFVDPAFFSGKTGTWYGLISKKPVFKVQDPWIQLDVVEQGIDHEPEWIKKGNLVSFKISTNMYMLTERPGSAGVPVRLNLTGPNETTFTTLQSPTGSYNLDKIFVYYSPFDTGAVWETKDDGKYPEGEYTAWATIQVNDIDEKNPGDGVTTSLKTTFLLSKIKPEKEKDAKSTSDKKSGSGEKDAGADKNATITNTPSPTPTMTPTQAPTEEPVPELTLDIGPIVTEPVIEVTAKPTKPPLPSPPKDKKTTAQKQPLSPFLGIISLAVLLFAAGKRR